MEFVEHQELDNEEIRKNALLKMLPHKFSTVLDAGAYKGYISLALLEYANNVIALDINKPEINHERIKCVQGNISSLDYPDNSFELVVCTEVLEHIEPKNLEKACSELLRVSSRYILVGIPYMQDTRVARTTCYTCGKKNPPWGHVSTFDNNKLDNLFPETKCSDVNYVGSDKSRTNFISAFLMDYAGNPFGAYDYTGNCLYCDNRLKNPPERNLSQKISTRLAVYINNLQKIFIKPTPLWAHVLYEKKTS